MTTHSSTTAAAPITNCSRTRCQIHVNEFYASAWLLQGTSGRLVRTRSQIAAAPTVPRGADGTATVLTDQDDATEIAWEDLPPYAQKACPALLPKAKGLSLIHI